MRMCFAMAAMIVLASCAAADAPSAAELKAQADFKKAYSAAKETAEKKDALKPLQKMHHPTTLQLLSGVVATEADRDVKFLAFVMLARSPARDPGLAKLLVQHFSEVKHPDTTGIKLAMAKEMSKSEFKSDIVAALADYIYRNLHYPEYALDTPSAIAQAKKTRAELEAFIAAFNKMTLSGISASKNAQGEVKKWNDEHQGELIQADRALTEKYRKADAEKAAAKK